MKYRGYRVFFHVMGLFCTNIEIISVRQAYYKSYNYKS